MRCKRDTWTYDTNFWALKNNEVFCPDYLNELNNIQFLKVIEIFFRPSDQNNISFPNLSTTHLAVKGFITFEMYTKHL